jgi:16S rRNA U516 pseudouridylate synthase RsuA-like enzyme
LRKFITVFSASRIAALIEGRNNQVRNISSTTDCWSRNLRRVKIGFLSLDVRSGETRHLTPDEWSVSGEC